MRRRTRAQKKLADNARLLRDWKRWRRERLQALLNGPYAEPAQALLTVLKNMPTPSALLKFVKQGPWQDADVDVRADILSLIDAAIIRHRERSGLPPFDDPFGETPLNVFLLIREHLNHHSRRACCLLTHGCGFAGPWSRRRS